MRIATDGLAVQQVRELLVRRGLADPATCRSTVVRGEEAGTWVVRTWTTTPVTHARPAGAPQFVHVVGPLPDVLDLRQVHPAAGR